MTTQATITPLLAKHRKSGTCQLCFSFPRYVNMYVMYVCMYAASPGAGCCGAAVFSSAAVRDADFLERRQHLPDVSSPDLTRPLTIACALPYSTHDGGLSYGQITTSIYLKISISDFFTLFSARTGERFFYSSPPAPVLLAAGSGPHTHISLSLQRTTLIHTVAWR